jgi:hypothetical protein
MGNWRIFDPPMTHRDSFGQRQRLRTSRSTSNSLWEGTRHREQHSCCERNGGSALGIGTRIGSAPIWGTRANDP